MLSGTQFDLLGYLALGIFVGTITSHSIKFARDFKSATSAIAVILPAALGGTAITFLEIWDKAKHGMPSYALGLLIGLMWVRASIAIDYIENKDGMLKVLGWLHLVSITVASGYAAWLFLFKGAVAMP